MCGWRSRDWTDGWATEAACRKKSKKTRSKKSKSKTPDSESKDADIIAQAKEAARQEAVRLSTYNAHLAKVQDEMDKLSVNSTDMSHSPTDRHLAVRSDWLPRHRVGAALLATVAVKPRAT